MITPSRLLLSLFLFLPVPVAGQGQVIFEQLPNQASFTFADDDCDACGPGGEQSIAEDFVLTTTNTVQLNQVVIWGVHDNGSPTDPNEFTVRIFEDLAGTVGTQVFQETALAGVAATTGVVLFGEQEVEVTLTLGTPPQLPAGTYWIEIFNNTVGLPSTWGWESGPLDSMSGIDGYSFSTTAPGMTWFEDNYPDGSPLHNMAMRLIGEGSSGLGDNYCVSTMNSTGGSATMLAAGSLSIAANDLVLSASPVPAGQPGIFFYGPDQVLVPFGNGFRCVAAGATGLLRLPVTNATAGELLTWPVDNTQPPTAAGQLTAGSTWNFQAWFRDPMGGGAFFNLADGLELTFVP